MPWNAHDCERIAALLRQSDELIARSRRLQGGAARASSRVRRLLETGHRCNSRISVKPARDHISPDAS